MSDKGAKPGPSPDQRGGEPSPAAKFPESIDELNEIRQELGEFADPRASDRVASQLGGGRAHMTVDVEPEHVSEMLSGPPAVFTQGSPDRGPTAAKGGPGTVRADQGARDPFAEAIRESGTWKDPDFSGSSGLRPSARMPDADTGGLSDVTMTVDTTPESQGPSGGDVKNERLANAAPPKDGRAASLPLTIDVNPGGYGEWDELELERRAAQRRREDEREQIEKEQGEWDEMVDRSLEMRDTPYSDLTTPEDVAREMGGVPLGDTDKPNTAEDAAGTPAPAGRVPPAASPASSASSRQRETAKGDGMSDSPMADREAEMAKRSAEINARVKAGAPVKPWNPVFIAKRAKSMSKKARQIAAAAGLAAVLAGLGICVSAATRPQVDPAQAAKPAPAPTVLIDLQRGLVPQTPTPRPTATPAPVGATVDVTVAYTFAGANCPADLRSREQRLGTKTVSNPAPGLPQVTNFGSMTFPKFCTPTLVVEGARQSALAPNVIFRPRTTFEVTETKDPVCLNPSTRVCTITVDLLVTNEAR